MRREHRDNSFNLREWMMATERYTVTVEQSHTDLRYDKAFQPHYFKQVKMFPGYQSDSVVL